jgi:hypothetical protein
MHILRFLFALVTIFVFAAVFFVSPVLANSDQGTASVAIADAEETIVLTYEAVLEAEQAGGNVTGLLAQLNEAGEFLGAARMFYRNGDFDNAIYFADLSRNIGEEVESAAYELKDLASDEGVQRMWFTILGSISGIILVVLGSLRVWWFLKRRYQ